ncbi:MAG: polysaccharide biosynthesis protein [Clostridia bacterium]|nr:polysaccharide biosynthesis protein [Clostridia bacterium]NCC44030.1 polysaccharide biosynthesis protein [Clostridia bacterium]
MGKSNTLVKNASFLMMATLISRIIGLLYKSPLGMVLGNVGLGYSGYANNVYVILLLISSYSIPMAVSKVVSERLALKQYKNAQKVFQGALLYAACVGGLAALVAFFLGKYLLPSNQQEALLALRLLAPTIFLSAILGVMRGFFQAHSTMLPTAMSQILEQIANAIVSIGAAWLFIKSFSVDDKTKAIYGAAGSSMGTTAGVIVGLIFMCIVYAINRKSINRKIRHDHHEKEETLGEVFKIIFVIVTPIIFNTFLYNASSYLDSKIFSDVLALKKVAAETVSGQWGEYSNYYITLINIPLALSSATSSAMMPEIASRYITKDYVSANKKINEGISLTMFLCIPAAVGLTVLAFPISKVLFPASSALSGQLLAFGAITVIFSALSTITNGVLQAIGQAKIPLRNAAISLVLNVITVAVCSWFLPGIGVFSVLISSLVFAVAMCLLNALSLKKYLNHKNDFKNGYGKPLIAAAGMGVAAWCVYYGLYLVLPIRIVCLALALVIAVLVYMILFVLVSKTTEAEMRKFPMGNYIVKVLRIIKVFR